MLTVVATNPAFSHLPASYSLRSGSACQALAHRQGAVTRLRGRTGVAVILWVSISCLLSPGFPLVQPLFHPCGLHLLVWELLCSKPGPSAPCWVLGSCCSPVHAGICRRRIYCPSKGTWLVCVLWHSKDIFWGRHIPVPTVPVAGGLYKGVVNANQHLRPSVILDANCTWAVFLLLPGVPNPGEPVPGMLQGCCS